MNASERTTPILIPTRSPIGESERLTQSPWCTPGLPHLWILAIFLFLGRSDWANAQAPRGLIHEVSAIWLKAGWNRVRAPSDGRRALPLDEAGKALPAFAIHAFPSSETERWLSRSDRVTAMAPGKDHWIYTPKPKFWRAATGQANDNPVAAQALRDGLIREEQDDLRGTRAYQVEYLADRKMSINDTEYLADSERVWAYTQGIALMQRAHSEKPEDRDLAPKLARWLCHYAQRGVAERPEETENSDLRPVIKGWHFSQNTKNDAWRDARLVTGANAWAVHGLGTFVASRGYQALSDEDQKSLKACYLSALQGLLEHRRVMGPTMSLMTAGWTTAGLVYARRPKRLNPQLPAYPKDPEEQWVYYDVLDAIGYEHFPQDPARRPTIRTYRWAPKNGSDVPEKVYGRVITLTQEDWQALRQTVKAENVVTEHNLDVLAVLNHGLRHSDTLGPESDLKNRWVSTLTEWRNTLREGIFVLLWDEDHWRADLGDDPRGFSDLELGRIVTGGTLDLDKSLGEQSFNQSDHVAIDNCSWLSLSVDHRDLSTSERDKLSRCLLYTVAVFAKNLQYGGREYYGTHYFKNRFRDPYIEESALQEASYHLEGTAGLILGLLWFADSHPQHPSSTVFREEALALWDGVEHYVSDWGFPYSSERIQDLSTKLPSSTAAIWYLDVHAYLLATKRAPVPDRDVEDVPFDHVALAFLTLADLIRAPDPTPISKKTLHEFALKLVAIRGKLASKFGQRVVAFADELLRLPALPLLASTVGLDTAIYFGAAAEVDLGLETILVGPNSPSPSAWEQQGTVWAKEVVLQPAGLFFRSEEEIRREVRMLPAGSTLLPSGGVPSIPFEDNRIYFIQMDWFGLETPIGNLGALTPDTGALWPVFALKSTRPRAQVLEDFIHDHKFWQQMAPYADGLPEPLQQAWLYLVELAIRSDFDRSAAEIYAVGAKVDGQRPTSNAVPPSNLETQNPSPLPGRGTETGRTGRPAPIPLVHLSGGEVMVVAPIEGDELLLRVDLGAKISSISRRALDRLDAPPGLSFAGMVEFHDILLGNVPRTLRFQVMDEPDPSWGKPEVDGVLGLDFWAQFMVEVDLPNHRLWLHPPTMKPPASEGLDVVPFARHRDRLWIEVQPEKTDSHPEPFVKEFPVGFFFPPGQSRFTDYKALFLGKDQYADLIAEYRSNRFVDRPPSVEGIAGSILSEQRFFVNYAGNVLHIARPFQRAGVKKYTGPDPMTSWWRGAQSSAQRVGDSNALAADIPLQIKDGSTPSIPARLANNDLLIDLDTGAQGSSITAHTLARLDPSAFMVTDFVVTLPYSNGTTEERPIVKLNNFLVGDQTYDLFVTVELGKARTSGGLLGGDFLHLHTVELDAPAGVVRLHARDAVTKGRINLEGLRKVPFKLREGLIQISMELPGETKVPALLDLGAWRSHLSPKTMAVERPSSLGMEVGETAEGEEEYVTLAPYDSIRLEGMPFEAREFVIDDAIVAPWGKKHWGLLGRDFFQGRRIVIDYKNRAVYIGEVDPTFIPEDD